MCKLRGFEVISTYEGKNIHIPVRKTKSSAGYDIESAHTMALASNKVTLVKTGIKAFMLDDEYLQVAIRSGLSIKNGLMLINSVGVIDADYYNNIDNEGEICVPLYNPTDKMIIINKGDRIAQGIFLKYLKVDNDTADGVRVGGTGSTGSN